MAQQDFTSTFEYWHNHPPKPFNMDAKPELGRAVSREYAKYCESCEDQSSGPSEQRVEEYARIVERFTAKFPSYSEIKARRHGGND